MKTITTDFSQEDTKSLKKQLKVIYIGEIIIGGVFVYLVYYFYKIFFILNESWGNNLFQILIISFSGVALVYLTYSVIQAQKDLKLGKKEILMGILSKKKEVYKYQSANSSFNKYNYYFYLDDEKIEIDNFGTNSNYAKAEVGQTVAIERTIYAKFVLKVEVLKEIE